MNSPYYWFQTISFRFMGAATYTGHFSGLFLPQWGTGTHALRLQPGILMIISLKKSYFQKKKRVKGGIYTSIPRSF